MNQPGLGAMLRYFLWLGTFVFGGPVVLCERMRKDLVEARHWITPEEYSEGFALSQMAPGPLATQLAIYLGWARGRVLWATLVGLAFVAPSFVIVVALAVLYIAYGGLPWIQGAFYGVGSAVIAIMATSSFRLTTKTFKRDPYLWIVGIVSLTVTVWTESESLLLFLFAGIAIMIVRQRVHVSLLAPWLLTGIHGPAPESALLQVFLYFAKAGAIVFGSGLAIVPFLHAGVVLENHWLNEQQFLDAVAVAMISPGPVVITVAFIGYLVSGFSGAMVAALGVFLPCYLFVIIPAPYFSRFAKNQTIRAFVDGVTTAAVGSIAGATVILAERALTDWIKVAICLIVLALLLKAKKIPEPVLILLAGVAGVFLRR